MIRTRRTELVLRTLKLRPGLRNVEISVSTGGVDVGQMSKLLHRLEGQGMIVNEPQGGYRGSPNSWSLTKLGEHAIT